MPEYFVWLKPSLAQVIEAVSEQDAAEAFMKLPVTARPRRDVPPECFVELAPDDSPQADSKVARFWVAMEGDPI